MNWMQNIDRRVIYGILLFIVVVGLLRPIPLPLSVSPEARRFFDAVENAPADKIAIVSTNWSASTQGENRPQTRVVITHLMQRHIRFAIISFDPQATTLTQALAEELAPAYHYTYGKDFINWGYRADVNGTLKGMVQDIPSTIKNDSVQHKSLDTFPVMQGVHNMKDVGVIAEASPSGTYKNWIGFVVGSVKAPFCFAPTSVMAPELYTYLDSGQVRGMMFGIKGAAEYEKLMMEHGYLKEAGFTTRAMMPVSLTLILLFVFIGLGNWGMFAARKVTKEE